MHIRANNPIGSAFTAIRRRAARNKGRLSCETAKIMALKMIQTAKKS
jgi:hypothetical protein